MMLCGAGAPMAVAPCWAPTQLYSLKLLSSSVPTSVTRPILASLVPPVEAGGDGATPVALPTSRHSPLPKRPPQLDSTSVAENNMATPPYRRCIRMSSPLRVEGSSIPDVGCAPLDGGSASGP